jgi:hypothetical protein
VADGVDRGVDARAIVGPEGHEPASEEAPFENLPVQGVNSFKHHPRPRFQFLPRMDERLPDDSRPRGRRGVRPRHRAHEQALHRPAARDAAPQQPRREHAGVVDDQEIAGAQEIGQRGNARVGQRAAGAVGHQQTRAGAVRRRFLRDEIGWEIEVEVADIHAAVEGPRSEVYSRR